MPIAIMRAGPIGIMKMSDRGEEDDRIVAVHADDPEYVHYRSVRQLPPHRVAELRCFLEE